MNEHETSAAIADETVIDAIEGAQAVDAVTADESSNPADRRLPLIFRIYGIIMLVEGVVTLPIIVLAALYAVRAVIEGRMAVDAINLTVILSVIHAVVLLATTACLAVFGVLLSFMAGESYLMEARPNWCSQLLPLGYLLTAVPEGIAAYLVVVAAKAKDADVAPYGRALLIGGALVWRPQPER